MTRMKKIFLISLLVLGIPLSQVCADETQETPRDEKGYKVNQDHVMNIPSDMKVKKFGGNVISPESDTDYVARKLEDQGKRIEALQSRLNEIDGRLKTIESKAGSHG